MAATAARRRALSGSVRRKRKQTRYGILQKEPGPLPVPFLVNLMIIQVFGLIMLFSASYTTAYIKFGDSYHYISNQFVYTLVGEAAMLGISFIDYHWLRRWTKSGYILTILLLGVVLTCEPINGCRRWLWWRGIPMPSIQVSEVAKFVLILVTAHLMCTYRARRKGFVYGILLPAAPLVPVVGLMFLEPHMSGIILICAIVGSIMALGGSGGIWIPVFIGAGGAGLWGMLHFAKDAVAYIATRLEGWTSDITLMTYQTRQSLYAIGSGGLLGLGLGNSMEKQLWLPECTNDFVFSVVCEELGFVGAFVVIVLFVVLIGQGLYIAFEAADLYGSLIAIGITAQIGWQVLCNIAVVTNSLPNTGISLPFFSSGGTSLLMLLGEMGVLLSIARAGAKARAEQKVAEEAERIANVTAKEATK